MKVARRIPGAGVHCADIAGFRAQGLLCPLQGPNSTGPTKLGFKNLNNFLRRCSAIAFAFALFRASVMFTRRAFSDAMPT